MTQGTLQIDFQNHFLCFTADFENLVNFGWQKYLKTKIDKNKSEATIKENIKFNKKEKLAVDSEVQNLKPKKVEEPDISEKIEFEKRKTFEAKQNYKTYDSYQNDRVVDEKKQSVKFDEKQPFPQFSLNVSNPISWKLMLLIMLMQLLTNMMLVVVLYLK